MKKPYYVYSTKYELKFQSPAKTMLYIFFFAVICSGITTLCYISFDPLTKTELVLFSFLIFWSLFFVLLVEILVLKLITYKFDHENAKQNIILLPAILLQLLCFKYRSCLNYRLHFINKYIIAFCVIVLSILFFFLITHFFSKYLKKLIDPVNLLLKAGLFLLLIIFVVLWGFQFVNVYGENKSNISQHKNIVLITVDSLRYDSLGYIDKSIHTPNIDALHKDGISFNHFYVHAPHTWSSLSSMMTSLEPPFNQVRKNGHILDSKYLTLAEILNSYGYTCYASGDIDFTTMGLGQGFEASLSFWSGILRSYLYKVVFLAESMLPSRLGKYGFAENSSLPSTLKAISFLQENRKQKIFLWIHYYNEPHVPYYAPKYYKDMYTRGLKSWITGSTEQIHALNNLPQYQHLIKDKKVTDADIVYLKKCYQAEISVADYQIGMLIKCLRKHKLYDNTMIVLTADHGEDFNDRGHFLHGNNLYNPLIHVPLIIKTQTVQTGKTVDNLARGIDIPSTILQNLNLRIPEQFHGRDLLRNVHTSENKVDNWCYSETLQYWDGDTKNKVGFSYTSSEYKFICLPAEGGEMLYDLTTDEHEVNNLAPERKDVVSAIKKQIEQSFDIGDVLELVPKKVRKIEKKQLEMLKSLGYVD